jgi:hypothetical protein
MAVELQLRMRSTRLEISLINHPWPASRSNLSLASAASSPWTLGSPARDALEPALYSSQLQHASLTGGTPMPEKRPRRPFLNVGRSDVSSARSATD